MLRNLPLGVPLGRQADASAKAVREHGVSGGENKTTDNLNEGFPESPQGYEVLRHRVERRADLLAAVDLCIISDG
jgi:hypothetical protein